MKRKASYIFALIVFIITVVNVSSITIYAASKLPRAKITGLLSHNWYEDADESYLDDESYTPEYIYYDDGDYNDDSSYYVKRIDIEWRKEKGNVKYQVAFHEKGKSWQYVDMGKEVSGYAYDFPKNKIVYFKVRTYRDQNGKRKYGKWSPIVAESTHDKEVHVSDIYAKNGYVKGYIKGAFKGEIIKVKIGNKTYKKTIKKTSKKYSYKIKVKKLSLGKKVTVLLCSKFGEVIYTCYNNYVYFTKGIGKGYTKNQVKWTSNWGSPDDTASASGGWSYWYYDDGSYIGFKNGKVKYWYNAAG